MTTLGQAEITALRQGFAQELTLAIDIAAADPTSQKKAVVVSDLQALIAAAAALSPTPPAVALVAPTGLSASASGGAVTVSWTNAPGATGSIIQIDGTQVGIVMGTGGSFVVQSVLPGSHTVSVADTNATSTGPFASTSVSVSAPSAVSLAAIANQSANQGVPFTLGLTATGGVLPIKWTAPALPAGLTINSSGPETATISGTPTATFSGSVTVTATDSTTPTAATSPKSFTLTVSAAPSLTIAVPTGFPTAGGAIDALSYPTPAAGTFTMPHAYAQVGDLARIHIATAQGTATPSAIASTNGQTGAWTLVERLQVPGLNNLCMDCWVAPVVATTSADALAITYSATATAQWSEIFGASWEGIGPSSVWTVSASGNVPGTTPSTTVTYPSLTAAVTSNPQVYDGFAICGTATGGSTSGVHYLDASSGDEVIYKIGVGSGATLTPVSAQSSSYACSTIGVIFELSLGASGVLTLPNPGPQSATAGSVFSVGLSPSGGAGGYTAAVTSGGLPPGVTLSNLTIAGTPATAGSYSVTVTVTDSSSATVSETFVITVAAAPSGAVPLLPAGVFNPAATIIFQDTFPGTSLDPTKWEPNWAGGPYNTQNGSVMNPSNVVVNNGLTLWVRDNGDGHGITGANIDSNPKWVGTNKGFTMYPEAGKPLFYQVVASVSARGNWYAWWCSADPWPQHGEVDLVEGPDFSSHLEYGPNSSGGPPGYNNPGSPDFFAAPPWSAGYHTWVGVITTNGADIYIDNVKTAPLNGAEIPSNFPQPDNISGVAYWANQSNPFYLILNNSYARSPLVSPHSISVRSVTIWK